MAGGKETTPIDELSGLPLPIYVKKHDYYKKTRNYHHHFHPKNDPLLQGYTEGKPVRYIRGQYVPIYLHNRYHDIYFGPPLPDNNHDRFTTAVLALAGVVPKEAIDLYTPGEADIVKLNKAEHTFIASPRRLHLEKDKRVANPNKTKQRERIKRFFANYVVEQALDEVITIDIIDKFVRTKSSKEKEQLGHFMLENAVDISVAELIPVEEQARREGMLAMGAIAVRDVVRQNFSLATFYQNIAEHAPSYP